MSADGGKIGSVMVVGGGIAGMQTALDLANSGYRVYLVESKPAIGGHMAQLDKTFPTNDCAMCTISPRLVEVGTHSNIEIMTLGNIESISGEPGRFKVAVRKSPRYVDEEKCTGCGTCIANCPVRTRIYTDFEVADVKLPDGDMTRIAGILGRYENRKEYLVSILQDIDAEYRHLPEMVLRYVAQKLGVPLSRIYNMATFYSAFSLTPRGKYKISVCLGTACHVRGGGRIMESLERELGIRAGGTTKDLVFSLEAVRCLGCCGLSPVFTVNEDLYGKASQSKIPKIVEKYRSQAREKADAKT
jgi:NADH:ubiquinone oxidoreductase subunit E